MNIFLLLLLLSLYSCLIRYYRYLILHQIIKIADAEDVFYRIFTLNIYQHIHQQPPQHNMMLRFWEACCGTFESSKIFSILLMVNNLQSRMPVFLSNQ